ncbi:MAG: response regulator [Deltaproteobacteria bacterium]|nr:response regulator [Deltaproteobacteria bacterium]
METRPILVVDDSNNILLTVSKALAKLGLPIETTAYAEDALLRLERGTAYAVILLDLELHGMGGLEMLRRLRTRHPGVPVVVITAYGTRENEAEARSLGAVDFIAKPFTPEEIRERVARAAGLEGARAPGS